MSKQDQRVAEGSRAYQAGRDVVVHNGMSAEQMAEIMVNMARQLSIYQADAMKAVDERLLSFREELLKVFAQSGRADPDAFRDPDFQYLLNEAQEAYARSGDVAVRDTLIDIIARRSLEKGRTRIALTLNDASTKAALLTNNEFAALSVAYLVGHTVNFTVNDFETLCRYIETYLMPFVSDLTDLNSSFWHLEAQSCAKVEMAGSTLITLLRNAYGGVLGMGFTREQLEGHLTVGNKNALDAFIGPCIHDPEKLQPNAVSKEVFWEMVKNTGVTETDIDRVWGLFVGTMVSEEQLISMLAPKIPGVEQLFHLWNNTPLKRLKLNSVGVAIGHANAVRVVGFAAPLGTWIN